MKGLFLIHMLLLVCICRFSIPADSASAWNNVSDQQSLLGLKDQISFDPKNILSDWIPNKSICNWTGVICYSQAERARALNLSGMDLEGQISPLIGNLSALESLDISNNIFHGPIPASLSGCRNLVFLGFSFNRLQGSVPAELSLLTHLKSLILGSNFFAGKIPSSLGNLTSLTQLTLEINNLTGSIPDEIGMLTQLQILHLHTNQLTGTIPSSLGNLSALTSLRLETNKLSGLIPAELGLLNQLQALQLFTNHLSGNIPSSLGNISAMTDLGLDENNLTGSIPVELGGLTKLNYLYAYKNLLTGQIPTSLLNCTALLQFTFAANHLSGRIPTELCARLTNLNVLYLWGNDLSGNIPISLGNCSKLKLLDLGKNRLTGMVPTELGNLLFLEQIGIYRNQLHGVGSSSLDFLTALTNCSHLNWMDVSYNHLTGVLPPSIGHLSSKLSYIDLGYNWITGSVPEEITNLTNLTYLELRHNLLSGNVPSGFQNLHRLERLYMSENRLEGNLPDEIGQMQSLGWLDVSWNRLSGTIPGSLGRLQQLRRLLLHHNRFSGVIPVGLSGCPNMELLDFSHNELSGDIPGEVMASLKNIQFYLNLSWNFLQGPLPREISGIVNAQAIDISGNKLDGEIPVVLSNCIALEYLNLSHNAFEGPIPDKFGKLQNLQDLDLSSNGLSGAIPMSLGQLKVLSYINLCFNNLTGPIPEEGLFPNNTALTVLLMGNPGLCGPKKYFLGACQRREQGRHLLPTKIIVALASVASFIIFSLILGIIRWKFSRRPFHLSNFLFREYSKFSYQDLVTATNGFAEANLLGAGNFGAVYKGILRDGNAIAIKVLNVQNEEGEKSFKTECRVLAKIRHRNLIRIISVCSYHNFKGLVLKFAANGSLEKHLYSDNNDENVFGLGLAECLNIAIDVAHGIEYLHHDSSVQVVHCDLKPSNVLLDGNMSAVVTDFGISRLITSSNSMDSLRSSLALRGSIGYIAPEYGLDGRVSTKGDLYSYGILLLEMVTRKKPTDAMFAGDLTLQKWVRSAFPNKLADIVDGRVLTSVNSEQNRYLISFIHVGLLCTDESPQKRPTMRDVGRGLETLRSTFMETASASNVTRTISTLACKDNKGVTVGLSDSHSSSY